MSTTYYFKNQITIEEIQQMTEIEVYIGEPHENQPKLRNGYLKKGGNGLAFHLWDWNPNTDNFIRLVKRYDINDPTEILFELRDKLDVLFMCEYTMAEYIHRVGCPPPPDVAWQDYSYEKTLDFGNPDSIYHPRDLNGNVIPYEVWDDHTEVDMYTKISSLLFKNNRNISKKYDPADELPF